MSVELKEYSEIFEYVKDFYGKKISSNKALTASACCTDETKSRFYEIMKDIPEIIKDRSYGCGSPFPNEDLTGMTVLDLGCGSGLDVFITSKLVGNSGKAIGIDMTEEQLAMAAKAFPVVMKNFGYSKPNIGFYKDYIEICENIPDESVDLVISNCVINLSPRKDLVFKAINRVLKPYAQFYISDIVCDRRLPDYVRKPNRDYGECLSGADYINDLRDVMEESGFRDVRMVSKLELQDKIGVENARFCSVTLRGFKIPELDRRCEDYGQFATYQGNCDQQPAEFKLDMEHSFEALKPFAVCRNTALMLSKTYLSKYFKVTNEVKHFGIFPCGPAPVQVKQADTGSCCS
ncbi:MAG: methyltransferase domain-containing protein [Planctomycetes bacterium]|nr:methyltransferase domain-containing protein [Planctomycetota bacterium]